MRKPKGCCHPDCFHCPLKDCKLEYSMQESAEINAIVKKMINLAKAEQKKVVSA